MDHQNRLTGMLTDIPLSIVSKNVLNKLSLKQLMMLKIAYMNGAICGEIYWAIQKKLERFHVYFIHCWASYITKCLVYQFTFLTHQMETVGLWQFYVRFGEYKVELRTSKPNIRFTVYKIQNGPYGQHIKQERIVDKLFTATVSPKDWEKWAKQCVLKALMAEYGDVNLSKELYDSHIKTLNVQGFMDAYQKAYKQHVRTDFDVDIYLAMQSATDYNYIIHHTDKKTYIGGDPERVMKQSFRDQIPQQEWIKKDVIPMLDKSRRLVDDITKLFCDPMSLLKKVK